MPEGPLHRGLLDTSVIVDLERLNPESLPLEWAVSAITMAELTAGPLAAADPEERARRQHRLQWVEGTFEAIPVDASVVRAYGLVYGAAQASGRKSRRRSFDLLIAATALAEQLPLFTRNPKDFEDLGSLIDVCPV